MKFSVIISKNRENLRKLLNINIYDKSYLKL